MFIETASALYSELYEKLTVRKDINADKLEAMSGFAGHLVNYVFLLAGQSFLATAMQGELTWQRFWAIIAYLALAGFTLVYWFRLAMTIQFYAMNFVTPKNPGHPELNPPGLVKWGIGVAVNVLFWVSVWNLSGVISTTLRDIAEFQSPKLEEEAPQPSMPHIPSCWGDQCIA